MRQTLNQPPFHSTLLLPPAPPLPAFGAMNLSLHIDDLVLGSAGSGWTTTNATLRVPAHATFDQIKEALLQYMRARVIPLPSKVCELCQKSNVLLSMRTKSNALVRDPKHSKPTPMIDVYSIPCCDSPFCITMANSLLAAKRQDGRAEKGKIITSATEARGSWNFDACDNCGKIDQKMSLCTGCNVFRYCDVACQRAHRPVHREHCIKELSTMFSESK